MAAGGIDLDALADAIRRAGHVSGAPSKIHSSWRAGETWLGVAYGATVKGVDGQVWRSTRNLWVYENGYPRKVSIGFGRYVDVLKGSVDGVGGIAREAKTGYVRYSRRTVTQIRKDGLLIRAGQIDDARWHFLPSGRSNTVGADPRILDLLDAYGIGYTIHLPIP